MKDEQGRACMSEDQFRAASSYLLLHYQSSLLGAHRFRLLGMAFAFVDVRGPSALVSVCA